MFSHHVSAQIYLRRLCLVAAFMMVTAGIVQAQALYGSLVGNVVDDSGRLSLGRRSRSRTRKRTRRAIR